MTALTPGRLETLYGELERTSMAPGVRRLVHVLLHRALADAVRWGRLSRNPAELVDAPRRGRGRPQVWTRRELRLFLEHVDGDRLYALWRLAITTGMRRGEVLGITWRALDLDGARLSVEQQLVPEPGGARLGPLKTERSRRLVALDGDTVAALHEHREHQRLERALAGAGYQDRDLCFCDELGRPVYPDRMTKLFTRHREAAGLPKATLHVLRHSHATQLLSSGTPLHVVAARLGDNPGTLLSVYAHLLPASDVEAAARAAAELS